MKTRGPLICIAFSACASMAHALPASERVRFNILEQPLDTALIEYSRQSGFQVISPSSILSQKRAHDVRGVKTPQQALGDLLEGSGLSFSVVGERTVAIMRGRADAAGRAPAASQPTAFEPQQAALVSISPVQLEEIVVTANHQVDTANKLSLSIAAESQQTLDDQGLKDPVDLSRIIAGLTLVSQNGGAGTFAIRGIASNVGAATTGVYLDDVPLTKRANSGNGQNNGAPLPPLFDLERVEVLKGPQGTLYGGSSEGGTVRFITARPSLTSISGHIQTEATAVQGGGLGYTLGGAVGGPLVRDKLAFRVSAMTREIPGYVDAYSPYDGRLVQANDNAESDKTWRGSLLWKFSGQGSVEAAYFHSQRVLENGPSAPTTVARGVAFTTPLTCNSIVRTVPFNNPSTGFPQAAVPTVIPCPAYAVPGRTVNGVYARPSMTYGPYALGRNDALLTNSQTIQPSKTVLDVGSVTVDYDFGPVSLKSISAYLMDHTQGAGPGGEEPTQQQTTVAGLNGVGAGVLGFPLWGTDPWYTVVMYQKNKRIGVSQEFRLSSPPGQKPFNWIAGLYYANERVRTGFHFEGSLDKNIRDFWGIDSFTRYGIPGMCDGSPCLATQDALLVDTEMAIYGEANFFVTPKVKITGGLRASETGFRYSQFAYGQYTARLPENPFSLTEGNIHDQPVTPKAAIEYDFTPNDFVYLSASQGYRPGGVNSKVSGTQCAVGLTLLGINANDVPSSYRSDSVWNYELGTKLRLLDGRLQLNGALYRIDWSAVQTTIPVPGCGQNFIMNGGRARSQGADLQMQYRPVRSFTLSLAGGFDNAYYIDPVAGPRPGPGVPASDNAGDPFPVPPWQVVVSAQYQYMLLGHPAYVRSDYQWQSAYLNGASYGTASYNPFTRLVSGRDHLSLRAGWNVGDWDLVAFVNNPLDSREKVGNAGNGRSQCLAGSGPGCSAFLIFNPFVSQAFQRPREFGLQANYQF